MPVRFYLAPSVSLRLTSFDVAQSAQPDVTLTADNIAFSSGTPTEGAAITVTATLSNTGAITSSGLTAAFFATIPTWGDWYIGSAFVPSIPASGTAQAVIRWDTLGFTGTTPIRVEVDPYNRVAETNESNNTVTTTLTIRTRPDLNFASLDLSDEEPVVTETVVVTLPLRNFGQTAAGAQSVALYQGHPDSGGVLLGAVNQSGLAGNAATPITFTWTPTSTGPYRLFARADRTGQVNEFDESNNDLWRDVYVGLRGPILIDSGSGNATDQPYTSTLGYGYVTTGTRIIACGGGSADSTLRAALTNRIDYRFDHLQPHHYYHLDLTLRDCDGNRAETVTLDDMLAQDAVDLSDHQPHRVSILVDPALYTDRSLAVGVAEVHGLDAMVAEISLHDVDYRYADAGNIAGAGSTAARDPQYPGTRGFGWLDGEPLTTWGALPNQTVRMDRADVNPGDDSDSELRYRFDQLDPAKRYRLRLSFRQLSGATIIQKVQIDGVDGGPALNLDSGPLYSTTVPVPVSAYQADGSIVAGIVRTDCAVSEAFVNEIALEEETLPLAPTCSVNATPYRTLASGALTIVGQPAPAGTLVEALNRDNVPIGCAATTQAGVYPYLSIYGESGSVPGMRAGELVKFRVNGLLAQAAPSLYWRDDRAAHTVNLALVSTQGQCTNLSSNWNLFSFRLNPLVATVPDVLRAMQGRYCQVLGESSIYDCTIDPVYQTLKELRPGLGYYVRITGTLGVNLRTEGAALPATTPLPLHAYWNWIGYLPTTTLPITTALGSIAGRYQLVFSQRDVFDPAHPELSTLWTMSPGQGYQIRATAPVTLTYPGGASLLKSQPDASAVDAACQSVAPTPEFAVLHGALTINGDPAPLGTRVEIVTPRGDVAGCFVTQHAGLYGYVMAYREDPTAPPIPGFRSGEPLRFRIDGAIAAPATPIDWRSDRTPLAVDLAVTRLRVYLPITFK